MNQGWECPKCGKCYGPQVQQCWTCGKNTYTPTYPQPYYPTIHWPHVTWGSGVYTVPCGTTYYTINTAIKPNDPPDFSASVA